MRSRLDKDPPGPRTMLNITAAASKFGDDFVSAAKEIVI
jgi:hypothetical protein